jgi:hypothetical protein
MLFLALQAHFLFAAENSKQLLHESILFIGHPGHYLSDPTAVHQHGQVELAGRGCDPCEEGLCVVAQRRDLWVLLVGTNNCLRFD